MREADIPCRVFGDARSAISWTEPYDGRTISEQVKKTKGSRVHASFQIYRRRQGNRTWRDEPRQNHVSIFAQGAGEVEFHKSCLDSGEGYVCKISSGLPYLMDA